jgi:hypothetical protein
MSARVRVVVLGASGELGARVCRLAARVEGAEVVGVSRNARGRAGVAIERGDVTDVAGVARLLRAGDLVVNCAGPFQYDAAPLVAACVGAGAHYCDLADDVVFAERVREAARRSGALGSGVFVCTGASTVPGLVGVFARAFASSPRSHEIARVSAYLSVGSRNPVSAALFASLLAPLGRALPDGAPCFAELRTLALGDGRTLRFGAYPAAFSDQRTAVGARLVPARFFFGFERAALTALLQIAAPALSKLEAGKLRRLSRAFLPLARAASVFGTAHGALAVVAEDASGRELGRFELAASAHGLEIPAAPPAWIAAQLARGAALPAGAVELHELVPLPDVVSWVRASAVYALRASGRGEL